MKMDKKHSAKPPESGTIYWPMWRLLSRCLHSASDWKPSYTSWVL